MSSRTLRLTTVAFPVLVAATLLAQPAQLLADTSPISDCVNALEQLSALQTFVPAYKQLPGDHRHYLDDNDRPAEIARLRKLIAGSCSKDRKTRDVQQAAADQLLIARSPECAIERDKLLMMEKPEALAPPDDVEDQRRLVSERCPTVPMTDVWLLQMVWAKK